MNGRLIIRNNYFDSKHFRLPAVDTNKFNSIVIDRVFDKIKLDSGSECILVEIAGGHSPIVDYQLYDYYTKRYFFASNSEEKFSFEKVDDSMSQKVREVRIIKSISLDTLTSKVTGSTNEEKKNDFRYAIVNFLRATGDVVYIKSYYLLDYSNP